MRSPVSTTWRRTRSGPPERSVKRSLPSGGCARERRFERAGVVVDHADLERRGAAEDVLGARRVLHARELHHHAVGALLLDDRLGDAELVDAVAQDRDVLLHGAVLDALLRLGLERATRRSSPAPPRPRAARDRGTPCRSRCAPWCARLRRGSGRRRWCLRARRRSTGPSFRASASGCRWCSGRRPCRAPPSCRPAAGNARRRADRGRDTSAARRSPSASAAMADSRFSATM